MGVSTNGIICFGIKFGEGHAFPWDAEPWEGDLTWWWRDVNGYQPPFEMFDAQGQYLPHIPLEPPRYPGEVRARPDLVEAYFAPRHAWHDAHPLPVDLVNYCSDECRMYILAVPSSIITAVRGEPVALDPVRLEMDVTMADTDALGEFCKRHKLDAPEAPRWWLSSYWG